MRDSKIKFIFFSKFTAMRFSIPIFLSEILEKQASSDLLINGVCDFDSLESGCALFCFDSNDFQKILSSPERYAHLACIFIANTIEYVPHLGLRLIAVSSPRLYFQKILELFTKKIQIHVDAGFDETVLISPKAQIGKNVRIGRYSVIDAHVVIEDGVKIGAFCHIHAGVVLRKDIVIGDHCVIEKNVFIDERSQIAHHTMIGADGFGFERESDFWRKIPHLSSVKIGQDCFIGSFVAIAAGILHPTVIGDRVIIDNHVQIAHHVTIGSGTAIAGCAGIAGSTRIGKNCLIGGAAKIAGHISVCDDVQITGMTMVTKSLLSRGVYSSGMPVDSNKEWKKKMIAINKMTRAFFENRPESIQP